ncbi:MAG: FecR domain-containing protein [Candidatus Obscuribacterales bacterium]|nr:FecR domain-containing protein [Candidatus Obscuribacterales bacterium]
MREVKAFCTLLVLTSLTTGLVARADNDRTAKLTEKHGDVYKRGFVDWNREEWGDPAPAHLGDHLAEGMQLGTGNQSWAQLTWKNVSARAWENSVYAIAPNQRLVYLMGGEMLFQLDKKRKDKTAAYYVWTKLLQARMRGTTALVQANNDVARVTVLEGTIDVLNRVDHSLVRLKPGVVYEIRSRDSALPGGIAPIVTQATSNIASSAPASSAVAGATARSINSITLPGATALPLFDSGSTVTSLLPLSPVAALAHPLLQGFTSQLPSLALISSALSGLPAGLSNVVNSVGLVTPLNEAVGGLVTPIASVVTGKVGEVVEPLADTVGGAVTPLAETVGGVVAPGSDAVDGVARPITSAVSDSIGGVVAPPTIDTTEVSSRLAPIAATPLTPAAGIEATTQATPAVASPSNSPLAAATGGSSFSASTSSSTSGATSPIIAPVSGLSIIKSVTTAGAAGAGRTTIVGGENAPGSARPPLPPELAVIVENTIVLQAPKKLPYKVGPLAGTHFAWPINTAEFPPIGRVVVNDDGKVVSLPGPVFASSTQSHLSVNNMSAGFIPGTILPGSFTSNLGTSTAGIAGMTAGLTGGIGSVTSGVGSITAGLGSVSGIVGGATGAISGTVGTLGGVIGGAGGIVGGGGAPGGILPGNGGSGGGGLGGIIPGGGGGGGGGLLLPGGGGGGLGGLLPGGGGLGGLF